MVCFKLKVLDLFKANLAYVINFIENNYSTLLESMIPIIFTYTCQVMLHNARNKTFTSYGMF
jgi:hypothetical protein